jgi:hypothetical protein
MELNTKPPRRLRSRLHFLARFVGLTGLLVTGLGLLLGLDADLRTFSQVQTALSGSGTPRLAAWLLLGGAAAVLLSLLVELIVMLRFVAGRRSAFGGNAVLQIVLAALLLVGVNLFAFSHYLRFDWTRPDPETGVGKFTLPESVRSQLAQLKGQTTIVVCQRHRTAGQLGAGQDAYDAAAERKVVEKVADTVELFRELGPRFRVVVLDVQNERFDLELNDLFDGLNKQLKEAKKKGAADRTSSRDLEPELADFRSAIEAMPESSIFFYGDGHYQRLSFNEFYALDKTASLSKSVIVLLEKESSEPQRRQHWAAQVLAAQGVGAPGTGAGLPEGLTALALAALPEEESPASLPSLQKRIKKLIDPGAGVGPEYKVFVLGEEDRRRRVLSQAAAVQGVAPCGAGPLPALTALAVAALPRDETLARVVAEAPELAPHLDAATDNTILIAKNGRVTRLSFGDFAGLSYLAAYEALKPAGNLVLLNQGVEPFARRVLNIEEKKPRIGIAVIHEVLTTAGQGDFGLTGLKKSLEAHGFEVRDVVLKKWSRFAPPEPAVYTFEESKLESIEGRLRVADLVIKAQERGLQEFTELTRLWKTATLDKLNEIYARQLRGRKLTEAIRKEQLEDFADQAAGLNEALAHNRQRRAEIAAEKDRLNVDELAEQRRMSDLQAKMDHMLADCDLLLIPRMTLRNVSDEFQNIPYRVHLLNDAQVNAVKDFLKAGKPVLACFGPANENERQPGAEPSAGDGMESLLAQVGIKLGKQTVLFDAESESFGDRQAGFQVAGADVKIPAVEFDWKPGAGRVLGQEAEDRRPSRLRESLRIIAHGAGTNLNLDLRHPRPVYFEGNRVRQARQALATLACLPEPGVFPGITLSAVAANSRLSLRPGREAEFMMTSRDSWNEDQPFPTEERVPRYEPPKPDDPTRGTLDEKRRGPFPIAVAVETAVPGDWYEQLTAWPPQVRVGVIGQGGFLTGNELKPAQEKTLLTTLNWLLARGDRLPHDDRPWSYPRVALDTRSQEVWHWGTWLGLPAVFAYLGMVVLLVRRMR